MQSSGTSLTRAPDSSQGGGEVGSVTVPGPGVQAPEDTLHVSRQQPGWRGGWLRRRPWTGRPGSGGHAPCLHGRPRAHPLGSEPGPGPSHRGQRGSQDGALSARWGVGQWGGTLWPGRKSWVSSPSRAFREPWFLSSSRPCDQREQIARQPIPLPAGRSQGRTRGARSLQSAFRPLGPATPVGEGGTAGSSRPWTLRLVSVSTWPSSSLRARGRSHHRGVGHASERPRAAAPGALSTHGANGHPATLLTIRVLQVDRPAVQTPVLWGGDIRR